MTKTLNPELAIESVLLSTGFYWLLFRLSEVPRALESHSWRLNCVLSTSNLCWATAARMMGFKGPGQILFRLTREKLKANLVPKKPRFHRLQVFLTPASHARRPGQSRWRSLPLPIPHTEIKRFRRTQSLPQLPSE